MVLRHLYQVTRSRRDAVKRGLSASFLSQSCVNLCLWVRWFTHSLLRYEENDFHCGLGEFQDPSLWRVCIILSGYRLCPLKWARIQFFPPYCHFVCFSRCLRDCIVNAWHQLLCMCSTAALQRCACLCSELTLMHSIGRQHAHHAWTSAGTTAALHQQYSGPSHCLWKPPAGSLSYAFSNQRQIASGVSSGHSHTL